MVFKGFNEGSETRTNKCCLLSIIDKNKQVFKKVKCFVMKNLCSPIILGIGLFSEADENITPTVQFGKNQVEINVENEYYIFDRINPWIKFRNNVVLPGFNVLDIESSMETDVTIGDKTFYVNNSNYPILYSERICSVEELLSDSTEISPSFNKSIKSLPHYRKKLFEFNTLDMSKVKIGKNIANNYRVELLQVLRRYHYVFSRNDLDIGLYNGESRYKIKLQNPIKDTYRSHPLRKDDREFLKMEVKKLLDSGIIEKSDRTRFYTGFVIVTKKNGKKRLCADSRLVNKETICWHNHVLPDLAEILMDVANHEFYTTIDMNSAYWQIKLPKSERYLYTFECEGIIYQFKRSSFGTRGMTSYFSSIMSEVLTGVKRCKTYLDDIVLYADSESEMIQTISEVLERFSRFNLTISLEKSEFIFEKITLFGYDLDKTGYVPISSRLQKLTELKLPQTKKKLQRALGGMNYYRLSAKDFKQFARPFYDIVANYKYDPNLIPQWQKLLNTFKTPLKRCRPVYSDPVELVTDSSEKSGGVVIKQGRRLILVDGTNYKGLILTSKIAHKELFMVYYAMKRYESLLKLFPRIIIVTDNTVVFHTLEKLHKITIDKITATVRWCTFISQFPYSVRHSKGTQPEFWFADALSRNEGCTPFPVLFGRIKDEELLIKGTSININVLRLNDVMKNLDFSRINDMVKNWQYQSPIKKFRESDVVKETDKGELVYDKFGMLYVPDSKILCLLDMLHLHSSPRTTLNRLTDLNLTFRGKSRIVKDYFKSCKECARINPRKAVKSGTSIEWASNFGDCFGIDVVHINDGINKYLFIAAVDHFSGFIQIEQLPDLTQNSIVNKTITLFCRISVPKVVVCDNAAYFGTIFKDLMESLNVKLSFTTPYNSRGNSKCERSFRSVQNKVKMLRSIETISMSECVQIAVFLINHTRRSVGYTPYELLSLKEDSYPFNIPNFSKSKELKLDSKIRLWLQASEKHLEELNKERLSKNLGFKRLQIKIGDKVLIKNRNTKAKSSITPWYSSDLYLVLDYNRHTGRCELERIDKNSNRRKERVFVHERNCKIIVDRDTIVKGNVKEDEYIGDDVSEQSTDEEALGQSSESDEEKVSDDKSEKNEKTQNNNSSKNKESPDFENANNLDKKVPARRFYSGRLRQKKNVNYKE